SAEAFDQPGHLSASGAFALSIIVPGRWTRRDFRGSGAAAPPHRPRPRARSVPARSSYPCAARAHEAALHGVNEEADRDHPTGGGDATYGRGDREPGQRRDHRLREDWRRYRRQAPPARPLHPARRKAPAGAAAPRTGEAFPGQAWVDDAPRRREAPRPRCRRRGGRPRRNPTPLVELWLRGARRTRRAAPGREI